eukprot:gene25870-biopygen24022
MGDVATATGQRRGEWVRGDSGNAVGPARRRPQAPGLPGGDRGVISHMVRWGVYDFSKRPGPCPPKDSTVPARCTILQHILLGKSK